MGAGRVFDYSSGTDGTAAVGGVESCKRSEGRGGGETTDVKDGDGPVL